MLETTDKYHFNILSFKFLESSQIRFPNLQKALTAAFM